jgi:uncharacterized protein (TIGR03067 family)
MRRLSLLFAVLWVLPLFGYDSPKENDGEISFVDGLQGTWQLTDFEDKTGTHRIGWPCVTTFQGGICTYLWADGDPMQTHYYTDTTRKPFCLDMDNKKCIYLIDSCTLRIAWRDHQRPRGFKEGGVTVHIYKRKK